MEKTRVDLHKCYYFLYFSRLDGRVGVAVRHDTHNVEDNARFRSGNYYSSPKEADSLVHKLNAVLKGAEVIEMPSEEEISQQATDIAWNRQDDYYDEEGNVIQCYGECYDSAKDMYKWLKSKIVK